jgi:dipeptide transport system ATP-binding protein
MMKGEITTMPLLDIQNLTVEFATQRGPFRAVDGISLSVEAREVLAIVGESGSGKSVAMLAVMGLLPWTGAIFSTLSRRRGGRSSARILR